MDDRWMHLVGAVARRSLGALLLLGASVCWADGASGNLDPDYGGGDGIAVAGPIGAVVREIAIDASGRTVAVGFDTAATNYRWFVARFTAAGDLDTSFAGGVGHRTLFGTSGSDRAMGVAIDGSGRILVGGAVVRQSGTGKKAKLDQDFALVRLLDDGSLDPAFGSGGIAYTAVQSGASSDQILAVLAQADGRIVAAGSSVSTASRVALVRYTSTGALDTSFGAGTGKVLLSVGTGEPRPTALRRDALGRYVFVTPGPLGGSTSWLGRVLADGSVDGSFGVQNISSALSSTGTEFQAQDLQIAADGTLLVAGRITVAGQYESVVARFSTGGALDTTFGSSGATALGLSGSDEARSLALQADGGIVVAAVWSNPLLGGRQVAVAARLLAGGTLDATYGLGGIGAYADGAGSLSGISSASVDAAGRLVGGGDTRVVGSYSQPMIVRWLP